MTFTKTILAASVAALMSTTAMAQDIAVIAGSIEDAFMDKIKKGVDDATHMVTANGGSVQYLRTQNYENFGPDLVTLINQAVAQGVDGIAIPVWVPDAQVPALQAAAEQGIKIMQYNSGLPVKADIGAINYFGSDEYEAGFGGGKYMAENGAEHILCHIQVPGAINLEQRCQGVVDAAAEAGIKATVLNTPANLDGDVTGTAEAFKAEFIGDSSIDAVISCADFGAAAGANAVEQTGMDIMIGAFDFSPASLDRISAGTQTMAIDQQPYLQGFLATSMLFAHLKFGTEISTDPVLTGPAIIDAANVDAVKAGAALGAR
ncbi:substrate-binding domain-containing protein [Tropicibacter naphthalenivorans]|uniref:Rhamnose ABC transporter, rhamnose-binding protein n=1 Tax=Tropicibacter naphthalenivorans TaxID=441103 RepID=A0A0N7M187_9RHOB|nr:substrate-binding domain-containing protein [Tropicibacter naphthalenivorans]CUH82577.1 rhamnose ABC transporter, rhamnose-binding protein [Tropicibacter naphthalenivorans]SMD09347.1 monosaccharide ABC transporter substrate-binding protein, CUT2 family [Tropicibacter naphthalenivorans]